MSSKRQSPKEYCHLNGKSLSYPELVFSTKNTSSGYPIDSEHPFVGQERARRELSHALKKFPMDSHCWLVGYPQSGRHTLVRLLAPQLDDSAIGDTVLLPSLRPARPIKSIILPSGKGELLVEQIDEGLHRWKELLWNKEISVSESLNNLRNFWEPLLDLGRDVAIYIEQILTSLEIYQNRTISNPHSTALQFIDTLESYLQKYRCHLLAIANTRAVCELSSCSVQELLGYIGNIDTNDPVPAHLKVQAGMLIKASGGVLIIDGDELAKKQTLWPLLSRIIRERHLNLSWIHHSYRVQNLSDCCIPLNLRIFIAISPLAYMRLAEKYPDLFTVIPNKIEFSSDEPITDQLKREFCAYLVNRVKRFGDIGISIDGISTAMRYCSRVAESSKRLDLCLGNLDPILHRASLLAQSQRASLIKDRHIEEAIKEHRQSYDLFQRQSDEMIDNDIIHIETDGKEIGQCNGLTIIELPEGDIGQPQRITAVIYASKDGLIDIERECQNGGKIHSKGTLILNGYILSCLGGIHTWPLGISLCMEQAYEGVDGDSASSAEAYAVLSALSDIPLKQGIAATGAIDQFGNVRAVGNVTEKVESFYRLCHRRGLTGSQGVIIPKANVDDLVLSSEIIRSLEYGKFHIWAVETLSEGIEILSDTQMGVLRGDRYPKRSIMGRIQSTIDMADT